MLPEFERQWKKLGFDDELLKALQEFLCAHPEYGDMIEGTGGLRKIRWSFPGTGKRGGIRALYVDFADIEKTYLITVFKKNQHVNLPPEQKPVLKQLIKALKEEASRKLL